MSPMTCETAEYFAESVNNITNEEPSLTAPTPIEAPKTPTLRHLRRKRASRGMQNAWIGVRRLGVERTVRDSLIEVGLDPDLASIHQAAQEAIEESGSTGK